MTIFHFIFVVAALFGVYIQTKSYALDQAIKTAHKPDAGLKNDYQQLLQIRRVQSPATAGLAAVLVLLGVFALRDAPTFPAILLACVWMLAMLGDIFMEGSYSSNDEAVKARLYIIGMAIFIIFTLGLGVGLIINAALITGLTLPLIVISVLVSIVLGILAYLTLEVSPENLPIVLVYTVSVTALLCGGIMSALIGDLHLAYIGIAYFISDWMVGLRDFGKRVPALLKKNILIVILMLYYSIMLTSIDFVF